MGRTMLPLTILLLSAAVPIIAQPQQQESLGDLARQLRAQKDAEAKKATKVYTNDNLPAPVPGEALNWLPPAPEDKPKPEPTPTAKPAPSASSEQAASKPSETPEDNAKTRDYWQGKFKSRTPGPGKGERAATTFRRRIESVADSAGAGD